MGVYGYVIVYTEEGSLDEVVSDLSEMKHIKVRHVLRSISAVSIEITNNNTYQTAANISQMHGVTKLEDVHEYALLQGEA